MRFTQTPDPLHSAAPAIIVLCICIIVAAAAGTLAVIGSMKRETPDRNSRDGYLVLRQTVEALYPPEFAKAEWNPAAQNASVEEAAQWVSGLIERWGE